MISPALSIPRPTADDGDEPADSWSASVSARDASAANGDGAREGPAAPLLADPAVAAAWLPPDARLPTPPPGNPARSEPVQSPDHRGFTPAPGSVHRAPPSTRAEVAVAAPKQLKPLAGTGEIAPAPTPLLPQQVAPRTALCRGIGSAPATPQAEHSLDVHTTEVHVSIGRIEVTAVQEAPQRRGPVPAHKPQSLEEYLARREATRR